MRGLGATIRCSKTDPYRDSATRGEDIMHLEKPSLARYFQDPALQGYARLKKVFFAPSASSQAAGDAFVARLAQRRNDRDQASGPEVAAAQIAAFREWEHFTGERFADLQRIQQPTLVVNGIRDEMIPVRNSYWLSENLPNAVLLTYPDSGRTLPVSRVLYAPGGKFPQFGLTVGALLSSSNPRRSA
jgi:pimeloyl-ACP methyl ester carboxylesterase